MAKNYLLIYSEQLATDIENYFVKILKLLPTLFSKFAKVQAVFMLISVNPITDKAKRTCFQNLKLQPKNVTKQKAG